MSGESREYKSTRWLISHLRKLNLYPRIFLIFCTCLLLSTLIITVFSQVTYTSEIEHDKVSELSAFAQSAMLALKQEKTHFEDSMEPFTRNSDILAALERSRSYREPDLRTRALLNDTMASITTEIKGVRAMIYVDGEGTSHMEPEIFGTVYVPDVQKLIESELYTGAVAAAGYPYWRDSTGDTSLLFYDNADQVLGIAGCLTLSYQLYTPKTRQPLGVLICCVSPEYLVQSLMEYTFQEGTNTFLVGDRAMVEGVAAEFSAPPFPNMSSTLLGLITSQKKGSRQLSGPDGEILMSFCGDPEFPVHVVNLTYRDYVMQPVYRLRWLNLAVMAAVTVLGALGYYLVAISIAHPVQRLVRTMKRVGSGHFEEIYNPESHDEIGVLCSEFDKMVRDMLELVDRMYLSETRQKELELAQKTAQLDALQMQVNPHFLYNTLDMIRWQCLYEHGGESPASDMIEKFCTLLRMTIKGDKQKETVADSLQHARIYLEVVNFRHSQKIELETEFNFDPGAYLIPCLSLQPILENAIRHGFSGEARENRLIQITGWREGNLLQITVSDNGQGMTEDQLRQIREQLDGAPTGRDHIGLRNVNQRCRLCYGENYGIHIDSTLDAGTMVMLKIPAEQEQIQPGPGLNL